MGDRARGIVRLFPVLEHEPGILAAIDAAIRAERERAIRECIAVCRARESDLLILAKSALSMPDERAEHRAITREAYSANTLAEALEALLAPPPAGETSPFQPAVTVFDEADVRIVQVTLRPEKATHAEPLEKVAFAHAYMRDDEASPTFLSIHLPRVGTKKPSPPAPPAAACETCKGEGRVYVPGEPDGPPVGDRCPDCGGSGYAQEEDDAEPFSSPTDPPPYGNLGAAS